MSIEDRLAITIGRLVIASENKSVQLDELTEKVKALEESANVDQSHGRTS